MAQISECENCKRPSKLVPEYVCLFLCNKQLMACVSQYGKDLDWKQENYTTHDAASVFRRYLTQMPVSFFLYLR